MPGSDENSYRQIVEEGLAVIRRVGMEPYLDLGAETHAQNRINRAFIDAITFEMRLLDHGPAQTETELFRCKIAAPIIGAALCESRILRRLGPWNPHYLEQIAGGLADAGTIMSTGMIDADALARVVDQGAPVIHIVKPYDEESKVLDQLHHAERLGCIAVGMDIDVFYKEKAWDEQPGPAFLKPQSLDALRRYVGATHLPFVIKGVLSVHDALHAQRVGASAVVVSFHGGEAIDYAAPVLGILPEIRAAVPDLTVLVDSGFRRGTDVLKALALGAQAAGVATLLLIACAARGRAGVARIMGILQAELQRTMSVTGCPSPSQIDRSILRSVPELLHVDTPKPFLGLRDIRPPSLDE